jgi:hypothetical protein
MVHILPFRLSAHILKWPLRNLHGYTPHCPPGKGWFRLYRQQQMLSIKISIGNFLRGVEKAIKIFLLSRF